MGVKSFFHELKVKASHKRLFKALTTDSHHVFPKATGKIKSVETVEGHGVAPGCVVKSTFHEGAPYKYIKNRIEEIDNQNYVGKFTLFEGDVLGDKYEKICYEVKLEPTDDGGSLIKLKQEYHTKGDYEPSEEEVKAGKEEAVELYKACDAYLAANPHVCA
ncbi:hypothetical protein CDL12_01981 [Handroanthus impetiginosus]|uniref:Bet v I/Major latex protein domain-containing protein n=1 Tax=Handroanthus impetiginosus TaxID=429701 RepID=A0A2G9I688_9LAMI|nr:hypothetical protein CDL12_01981 [Handroanthus impetiginosus]